MYGFLEEKIGRVGAYLLTATWYAVLILLVFYASFEPQAEFSYLRF